MSVSAVKTREGGATHRRSYTCADGTGILINKVLTLADPNTASEVSDTPSVAGYKFAGISAMEKEASDGSTTISAWTNGVWDLEASGAITAGSLVYSAGNGEVAQVTDINMVASGAVVGRALETASDTEVIKVAVGSII